MNMFAWRQQEIIRQNSGDLLIYKQFIKIAKEYF